MTDFRGLLTGVLLLSGVVYSGYGQQIVTKYFPIEKKLEGKGVDLYVRCDCIGLIDSNLMVVQLDGNPIFNIYRPDDFMRLKSFGLHGKGPNEFIGLTFCYNQVSKENGKILIWVIDWDTRLFQQIAIDADLNKRGMQIKKQFHLTPETNIEHGIFYINDSLLVGTSISNMESSSRKGDGPYTKLHHFFRYNPMNKTVTWTKPYPSVKFESDQNCGSIYQDRPMLKPDGTKIACPSAFFDQIIIYNPDGKELIRILSSVKAPKMVLPNQSDWFKQNVFYYGLGYATDNFIYVIYQNETGETLGKEENRSEIHVFDWSGKGVCRYKTNFPLSNVAVDEKTKTIYAGQVGVTGDIAVFRIGSELQFK